MSVSGSCSTTCIRILFRLLEDRSCRTTCARSLYSDSFGPLVSSCGTGPLVQDLCIRILQDSARSPSQDLCVRILLDHLHQDLVNEQILQDFLENWRSGLPKGASYARRPRKLKMRYMWDFPENWESGAPKRAFCARLPRKLKFHTGRRPWKWKHVPVSEVLRLPRNHDPRSYEMLRWPRKLILKFTLQKCNRNPSQESSPSTSKHGIHGADFPQLPRKTQSFEWRTPANVLATSTKHCACHDFHKVSDSLRLPRKLTFRSSKAIRSPAPVTSNHVLLQNVHGPFKIPCGNHSVRYCRRKRKPVRACALESRGRKWTLLTYRKNPIVWTHCLGNFVTGTFFPICLPAWSPFWAALGCPCRLASLHVSFVFLHDLHSGLLLAVGAALSPFICLPAWSPFWAALGCPCCLVSLHLSPFMISVLGCSWLPLPPCLPSFVPLHNLHSGLLLAAAAALSPKLVSLHDLHSGFVSLHNFHSGLLLAVAAALLSQLASFHYLPFFSANF